MARQSVYPFVSQKPKHQKRTYISQCTSRLRVYKGKNNNTRARVGPVQKTAHKFAVVHDSRSSKTKLFPIRAAKPMMPSPLLAWDDDRGDHIALVSQKQSQPRFCVCFILPQNRRITNEEKPRLHSGGSDGAVNSSRLGTHPFESHVVQVGM